MSGQILRRRSLRVSQHPVRAEDFIPAETSAVAKAMAGQAKIADNLIRQDQQDTTDLNASW